MGSFFGAINLSLGALAAEQTALSVTANNISNINTPGYSRERVDFTEAPPTSYGGAVTGHGVSVDKVESLRDSVLQLRINDETQNQSGLNSYVSALQSVEGQFSGNAGEIGSQITQLFNNLESLSTDPTNTTQRSVVLGSAQNLATAFHVSVNKLTGQQSFLDSSVSQSVSEINRLNGQIAHLNVQVAAQQNLTQDAGGLTDQRDELIRQLSQLVDISVIPQDNGLSITTRNGTALVAGDQSFSLSTHASATGFQNVFSGTTDITSTLTGGKIGGLLKARDTTIPSIVSSLDTLAYSLATSLNTANRAGFDLHGNAGTNLFTPPTTVAGSAAGFTAAITDPNLIAASSDGTPGSNGNLQTLLAVRDQATVSGQKPVDFYSSLVYQVGSEVSNGSAELDASKLVLQQLNSQRGAISGVNLDEEAAHLTEYQRGYDSAARVVSVINQLLGDVINLGTQTTF